MFEAAKPRQNYGPISGLVWSLLTLSLVETNRNINNFEWNNTLLADTHIKPDMSWEILSSPASPNLHSINSTMWTSTQLWMFLALYAERIVKLEANKATAKFGDTLVNLQNDSHVDIHPFDL